MTPVEALDVLQHHRSKHSKERPNELITDEALKVAVQCVNQVIRFHKLTDNNSNEDIYSVKELRRYIFQGER